MGPDRALSRHMSACGRCALCVSYSPRMGTPCTLRVRGGECWHCRTPCSGVHWGEPEVTVLVHAVETTDTNGTNKSTRVPWPTVLLTSTWPRCNSTMRLTMARPRPLPSELLAGATLWRLW
jgi:hypothetical protein